jgi:hypothetical protein
LHQACRSDREQHDHRGDSQADSGKLPYGRSHFVFGVGVIITLVMAVVVMVVVVK